MWSNNQKSAKNLIKQTTKKFGTLDKEFKNTQAKSKVNDVFKDAKKYLENLHKEN